MVIVAREEGLYHPHLILKRRLFKNIQEHSGILYSLIIRY